ncbi:MAG: hypothetical protein K2X54_21690 [Methylobacterium organophilum]|nr:hypothetical protein [Methylobacterium organophilum]
MHQADLVEFPSGRLLPRSDFSRRTVAALAKALSIDRSMCPGSGRRSLHVSLQELAGLSDRTIDLLADLAERRVLTPASAARLAMRHAHELGGRRPAAPGEPAAARHSHHLALVGDPFDRAALRMEDRTNGSWVACATLATLDLLYEVCPTGIGPVSLVLGPEGRPQPAIALRRSRDWCNDLARLAERAGRSADQHVLVLGGLPGPGRDRALVLAGIEDGLRRGGLNIRARTGLSRMEMGTALERADRARRHLVLIEIVFPGLVGMEGEAP